ncbi:MAG: dihydroxyacetone kinase family protein [Candidatus Nanopelagicales bacterium]|nr:dihydroxyacetone kinase family protein [Candidatus Nanopelagicales bacterium]
MTRIHGDPALFKGDVLAGFAAAYGRYVARVPGASGFVRSTGNPGRVALVVGGGSGHFPSYPGIVGTGFAEGCVVGDVFTSPSAEQIYRIARAADAGAGVVLAFGNYAGDRLNFAAAQERLIACGIQTTCVYVTDDIASASPEEQDKRRGIAGTFVVYKVGGASAQRGDALPDVERLMRRANERTFSFGVAFSGCTLPGRSEPLFTVGPGRMEFGLGIHGEPGVSSRESMPADELAAALVDAVLAERPTKTGPEVAVIVNGLGATKYEELFVLYRHVDALLRDEGLVPVLPEVGEFVTSLDMAGCSLTVTWLDDELLDCWSAPADTASFRRGDVDPQMGAESVALHHGSESSAEPVPASSAVSRGAADAARRILEQWVDVARARQGEWGRLDAVAGDGDHGSGMLRGLAAAADAAAGIGGVGWTLRSAGSAFSDSAGGTSGILWGIALAAVGESLGDEEAVTPVRLATAMQRAVETLMRIGGARPGHKTMLDTMVPFVHTFREAVDSGSPLAEAWTQASQVGMESAASTADLSPRVGRARPLAQRSVGTPDPGATSAAELLVSAGALLLGCPAP